MADPTAPVTTVPSAEERNWAVIAHLSAFAACVVPAFGAVLGPLAVWLLKKDQLPFVNDQAREALNFQITVLLAAVACWILAFVLIGFVLFGLPGAGGLDFHHHRGGQGK